MKYLLDTNTCIYALNRSDPGLTERLRAARRSDLYVSTLTIGELLFGARRSTQAVENVKRVVRFVAPLRGLPFDRLASEAYGSLRAGLAAAGRQFGPVDMLIAATALAHGLTVVTNNAREFERAPGLRVENWALPIRH
ncbi:MAG: type II toxin-antitoxin system VapC family toxin [Myxococcaceae bacterium]